jgi:hypothetical protein
VNSRLSRFGAASPTSPWYDPNFFRRTLDLIPNSLMRRLKPSSRWVGRPSRGNGPPRLDNPQSLTTRPKTHSLSGRFPLPKLFR